MGGSKSHEYHLISPGMNKMFRHDISILIYISIAGEDTLLSCSNCGYTANEELAVGKLDDSIKNDTTVAAAKENQVCKALGLVPKVPVTHSLLRFASLDKEGVPLHQGTAVVLARQGRTINMLKVEKTLTTHLQEQQLFTDGGMIDMTMTETIPSPSTPFHLFIDDSIDSLPHVPDHVITHGPDHFRTTEAGDLCASCHHESSKLTTVKAIEVGHTFYLGTKYSSALGCTFLPEKRGASPKPAEMGCFGIGISRLVATAAEVCHDDRGIVWPSSIAPYRVCIVPTSNNNAQLLSMAESIYDQLENDMNWRVKGHAGSVFYDDVVIDDRKQMFGAKMADAELIGYPFIVVLGKHALETGVVEVNQRIKGQANIKTKVPVDELGSWLFERQML